MFPFFPFSCGNYYTYSPKAHKEQKLQFLKWMRDELETRLAGVNGAISNLEDQIDREQRRD